MVSKQSLIPSTMVNQSITSLLSFQNITAGSNGPFSNNFTHSNLIKLDRNNYILWRSQILPTLRGHDLEGYINGTHKCPSKFAANDPTKEGSSADTTVSATYIAWRRQDQLLLS